MGICTRYFHNLNMNKFALVVCFAAAVSAEADADAFYGVYGYGAVGVYPYATYAYAAPSAYAQVSPSASLTTVGLAQASLPAIAGGYAGAGRYVANSAGVVHVAKREAEAEADPALLYRTYGYLDTHMLESMEPTLDTHTPMDTMERDLLRLSQRLMLLFSMEPMLDTPMPMEPTLMELTHTDMDMPGESNQ